MTPVQTTSERLGKDQVRLRVEVPEKDLDPAIASAYRRWASEIKVPGFRKGKVPRQLIDARVGPEVIREEALRDALPDLYREALRAESLEAIAPPDIEVTQFESGAPLVFEATVDVRPEIELPAFESITVEAPPSDVTDDELAEQLDRLRDRFAELESVAREARRGDYALIDLNGSQNGEPVEGATAPDYLYEVGSGSGPPKLDEELEGARAGAILKFTDNVHIHREDEADHDHSHTEDISFTVLVKEVKAKKLPPLDDDFAKTVGEFERLEDLNEDLRGRIAEMKRGMVEEEIRSRAIQAFVDASNLEPPEKLVETEFEHRLSHVEDDLKRAGMTLEQYAHASDATELEIRSDMRKQAARSVTAELLLEELARSAGVEVTEEDIGLEIAYLAARAQKDPKEVAQQITSAGRLGALAADILRRKALDHLVANIEVIGRPEPPEPLEPPEAVEASPDPDHEAVQASAEIVEEV